MTETVPILVCRGVEKTWAIGEPNEIQAVCGVDLEIERHEFVALLGPSGCGKSTLLQLIAGIEPPTAGSLSANGRPIDAPSPDRPIVFQAPSLFPWLTVSENVGFGLKLRGVGRTERRAITDELLIRIGLREFADLRPDSLSLGMRQRVAVARALAMQPRLLLLDEPFAALDIQTRRKMQDFLVDIRRASQASVVLVTHDLDEAIALADRIFLLTSRPGRIKAIFQIDEPGPRDPLSPQLQALRRRLSRDLQSEVDRAFAEQEMRQ
jgi:NitT/TauT family transport system ATP-binding protein